MVRKGVKNETALKIVSDQYHLHILLGSYFGERTDNPNITHVL